MLVEKSRSTVPVFWPLEEVFRNASLQKSAIFGATYNTLLEILESIQIEPGDFILKKDRRNMFQELARNGKEWEVAIELHAEREGERERERHRQIPDSNDV